MEKELLGLCIRNEKYFHEVLKMGDIFLTPENKALYHYMVNHFNQHRMLNYDIMMNEYNDISYLMSCYDSGYNETSYKYYLNKVVHSYSIEQIKRIQNIVSEPKDAEKCIDSIKSIISGIEIKKSDDFMTFADYFSNDDAGMYNNSGVETGYNNRAIRKFYNSELIIIAARPKAGKTTLAINICGRVLALKQKAGFFSCEMKHDKLFRKLLQVLYGLTEKEATSCTKGISVKDIMHLKKTKDNKMVVLRDKACEQSIFLDDTPCMDIDDLYIKAKLLKIKHNIDIIFVDYLQLLRSKKHNNKVDEIEYISQQLKAIAKDLNIPVVALAQLNRSAENSTDVPNKSHLKGSGGIEQNADMIYFLHPRSDRTTTTWGFNLILAENRNGATAEYDYIHHLPWAIMEQL